MRCFREIWISNLPNDGSDMYTSVLTIEKTSLLDSGQYTCQVVDWGVQQCKSIYIEIRDEPDVKVVPMSAIIEKVSHDHWARCRYAKSKFRGRRIAISSDYCSQGSNIQLTCTTPNMRNMGIGFGWTKNRALLKLEPGLAIWEDLYPAGSILKITNAQVEADSSSRSGHFFCCILFLSPYHPSNF